MRKTISKSGFRKGNTIWPGSSISEFRLLLFRVFSVSFSCLYCLLFEFWTCFVSKSGCLLRSMFSSASFAFQFTAITIPQFFQAVCRAKRCEVSKLSRDIPLKLHMGNRMVVMKRLTNKYYLIYRDVMFLKVYLKISRKDRRRILQGAFFRSSFGIGIYSRFFLYLESSPKKPSVCFH